MKRYAVLAGLIFLILGAASVWMGGLNQDEGWYLYAANLVAEGQSPYRDFFFTQGPVMPYVYSAATACWRTCGLLGARVFTLALGALGILTAAALAYRLAPRENAGRAALTTALLLGCNLYHIYYLTIPKTYALAALFVLVGFLLSAVARETRFGTLVAAAAGMSFAFAAGTRISLAVLLPIVAIGFLLVRAFRLFAGFTVGALVALALVYAPFLADGAARDGLIAAQRYHAARGGFDPVWCVGSVSRLVRWYLPIFLLMGLGGFAHARLILAGFAAVVTVQMLAPFPYEDYQVPVMALAAVFAAVNFSARPRPQGLLLTLGVACACSFGSPLLEKWATNGQDRFWSLKKSEYELPQLRRAAVRIEALDPGGRDLLTQDLYLAIETRRKVPHGLEMGPFAMLSDDAWTNLIASATCRVAALSGYSFAIAPPVCDERPVDRQLECWKAVRKRYALVERVENFGQNATPLLILKKER